jgi:hypothetical protein
MGSSMPFIEESRKCRKRQHGDTSMLALVFNKRRSVEL